MTLKEIIDAFSNIAKAQPNIRTIIKNDIYSLNTLPNTEYGVFGITQNTHSSTYDYITYNFNLFYIDRLTDENDYDYQIKIQSDGMIYLRNIINIFNNAYPDARFDFPINFITFNQRFTDICAGVYCVISIEVPNDLGDCYEE